MPPSSSTLSPPPRPLPAPGAVVALAMATALSLGLARFSYALMLPPMRADLDWSYLTAGAMNTANAAGYLLGALLMPWGLRYVSAWRLMVAGGFASAVLLAGHGLTRSDEWLYTLRCLTGVASAVTFVAGGLLAARLAGRPGWRSGLVLGVYYGGVGAGVIVSAWLVPFVTRWPQAWPAWQGAWVVLGAVVALAALWNAVGTRGLDVPVDRMAVQNKAGAFAWAPMAFGLGAYFLFGMGYIGYMTFAISLLRERDVGDSAITLFYTLLGLGTLASSWMWAGVLQRWRGGQSLMLLNALLVVATLLPVFSVQTLAAYASGALFGCVFLSVVASTTALVRHNLPPDAWARGIGAFTVIFALGQIVGPSLVGWLADGPGGLPRGLAVSAALHALAAAVAWRQKPLTHTEERRT